MSPASSASDALTLVASRTISSASSAFRPCSSARAVTYAAASFSILRPSTSSMSAPVIEIGEAEPMLVCGAIAATSAAWVTKSPADAARAPFGDT